MYTTLTLWGKPYTMCSVAYTVGGSSSSCGLVGLIRSFERLAEARPWQSAHGRNRNLNLRGSGSPPPLCAWDVYLDTKSMQNNGLLGSFWRCWASRVSSLKIPEAEDRALSPEPRPKPRTVGASVIINITVP